MQQNQWLIVQTNPQREMFVAKQLDHLDPYLPRFKNPKGRIVPLFPSYLFVPSSEDWGPIKNTVGVRALLMANGQPASIPDKVIISWRGKERGGLVRLPPPPRFHSGQRLTITEGSLRFRSVIYAGMSGKDRERVLIEMLGQYVTIRVPTTHLAPEFEAPTRNSLRRNRKTHIEHGVAHRA